MSKVAALGIKKVWQRERLFKPKSKRSALAQKIKVNISLENSLWWRFMGERLDVVVPTYNSSRTLHKCLICVTKHIRVNRLIVVDKFSNDRTVEIARSFDAEVIQDKGNIGQARALGISLVSTPRFLFVDDDVYVNRKWYDALKTFADKLEREDKPWGSIGGLNIPTWEPYRSYISEIYSKRVYPLHPERILTSGALINTIAAKGFKCDSPIYEDFLLGVYMTRKGYPCYIINAKVEHDNAGNPKGLFGKYYRTFRNASWAGAGLRKYEGKPIWKLALAVPWFTLKAPLKYKRLVFTLQLGWFWGAINMKKYLEPKR